MRLHPRNSCRVSLTRALTHPLLPSSLPPDPTGLPRGSRHVVRLRMRNETVINQLVLTAACRWMACLGWFGVSGAKGLLVRHCLGSGYGSPLSYYYISLLFHSALHRPPLVSLPIVILVFSCVRVEIVTFWSSFLSLRRRPVPTNTIPKLPLLCSPLLSSLRHAHSRSLF